MSAENFAAASSDAQQSLQSFWPRVMDEIRNLTVVRTGLSWGGMLLSPGFTPHHRTTAASFWGVYHKVGKINPTSYLKLHLAQAILNTIS